MAPRASEPDFCQTPVRDCRQEQEIPPLLNVEVKVDTQVTAIDDVKAWKQAALDGGLRRHQRVMLRGEFRGNPQRTSRQTNLILPRKAGDDSSGFASLGGYVVQVQGAGTAGDEVVHCLAELTGYLRIDVKGQLSLGEATLTLKPNLPGPYTSWRARQCRLSGIQIGQRPRLKRAQTESEVTAHLTANAHKQILWVGSREIHAYGDVVRGEHDRVDPKIADRLKPQGVILSSRNTPQDLAALLDGVSADDTALVIIARGGGDVSDLAWLENATLLSAAKNCATRVPIILAAGHRTDDLLLSDAVTWNVGVPSDLGAVLRPFCHGWGGASADRKTKELQRRQAHSLQTQVHELTSENSAMKRDIADMASELERAWWDLDDARRQTQQAHDRTAWQLQVAAQRLLDGLADQARRHITRTYRLACLSMVLLAATAWLALRTIAPELLQRHDQFAMGSVIVTLLVCLHLALAPRWLGKQPRFASSKPVDREVAFRSARTVRDYNRALHAKEVASTDGSH